MTEAGTVKLALLLESETAVLLEAALENVTVQVDAAPELRVEGEQANEVRVTGLLSVIVAVFETPLSVAVTTAELSVVRVPAVAANVAVD